MFGRFGGELFSSSFAIVAAIFTTVGITAVAVSEVGAIASHKIGENGAQTPSRTTWRGNGGTERLDVENPSPGKRDGQIHYHDAQNNKYMFDFSKGQFQNPTSRLTELLSDNCFLNGLKKAFKILGEMWG